MTIGLFDIEIPTDKPARLKAADDSVSAIDRQFQRGLITDDERYEQVVGVWQETSSAMSDEMMRSLDPNGPVTMMTASGARGNKGNIGQLGAMRGLMADPSGPDHRRPGPQQLPRGHDRPRVLHLDPRRPQGPRRYRPAHGRLRVPHPAPGRRRPGRHHPRGGLRHRGGQLDHPERVERREGRLPEAPRRPAGRGPAARPARRDQEGRRADPPGRSQRADHGGGGGAHRCGRRRRGARPLTTHLRGPPRRLPGVLRPQPRHRRDGRLG